MMRVHHSMSRRKLKAEVVGKMVSVSRWSVRRASGWSCARNCASEFCRAHRKIIELNGCPGEWRTPEGRSPRCGFRLLRVRDRPVLRLGRALFPDLALRHPFAVLHLAHLQLQHRPGIGLPGIRRARDNFVALV